ncbi:MAG: WecB/TagA/CpsF family glycosyltransferase [Candidatus Gastranaerophilales bacterium]|nr:WecB/TagA/CpsF family glycosyltransferase [Candidatus Gastranaerophilales bacterium]
MDRVKLLGYGIDTFSFDEAVEYALELEKQDKTSQVITINPEMFDCAKIDAEFAEILNTAEMVIPDGVGVKIGLKILGENVSRIAGVDFARRMLEKSAEHNLPVAIIGAKPDVIKKTEERLKEEIPNLNIVYSHDGYFDNNIKIINDLKQASPRLILVALGAPKQEKFINEAKKVLPFGLMVGVGGSFDVWSGTVERAPEIYQKLGIEWLYRTIKQPERFKRIFPTLPLFVLRVIKEKITK